MKQNSDGFIHRQVSCRPKGSKFQSSSLQFAHSAQPYNDSSLPNSTESRTFRVVMVTKLTELALVFFQQSSSQTQGKYYRYLNLWFRFTAARTAKLL